MEVKVCKISILTKFRYVVYLLFAAFLLTAGGCSTKTTVSYIPQDENENPPPHQEFLNLGALAEARAGTASMGGSFEQSSPLAVYQLRRETLEKHYDTWKGTRYRYGGLSLKGVDCSGFALLTYKELFGKSLPRTVGEQAKKGQKVKKTSLQPGDLVFFKTGRREKHVGIYLEDERFMHASLSHGVMISDLNDRYWKRRFWQAKRI